MDQQTSMVRRVGGKVRRTVIRRNAADRRVPGLRQRVDRLTRRVEELEAELMDARSQGRRVAELCDIVTELLANEASRRDPEFQRILDKFDA